MHFWVAGGGDDTEALKRFSFNPRLQHITLGIGQKFWISDNPRKRFPRSLLFSQEIERYRNFVSRLLRGKKVSFKKRNWVEWNCTHSARKGTPPPTPTFLQLPVFPNISFFFFFLATDPKGLPLDASTKGEELLKMGLFCRGGGVSHAHLFTRFFSFLFLFSPSLSFPVSFFLPRQFLPPEIFFCGKKTMLFAYWWEHIFFIGN